MLFKLVAIYPMEERYTEVINRIKANKEKKLRDRLNLSTLMERCAVTIMCLCLLAAGYLLKRCDRVELAYMASYVLLLNITISFIFSWIERVTSKVIGWTMTHILRMSDKRKPDSVVSAIPAGVTIVILCELAIRSFMYLVGARYPEDHYGLLIEIMLGSLLYIRVLSAIMGDHPTGNRVLGMILSVVFIGMISLVLSGYIHTFVCDYMTSKKLGDITFNNGERSKNLAVPESTYEDEVNDVINTFAEQVLDALINPDACKSICVVRRTPRDRIEYDWFGARIFIPVSYGTKKLEDKDFEKVFRVLAFIHNDYLMMHIFLKPLLLPIVALALTAIGRLLRNHIYESSKTASDEGKPQVSRVEIFTKYFLTYLIVACMLASALIVVSYKVYKLKESKILDFMTTAMDTKKHNDAMKIKPEPVKVDEPKEVFKVISGAFQVKHLANLSRLWRRMPWGNNTPAIENHTETDGES